MFLDPGTNQTAYAIWDGHKIESAIFLNDAMRVFIEHESCDAADVFAIENIASYGMSVGQEVFETCIWIGRFFELFLRLTGNNPTLVFRKDIKMYHCFTTKAKDSNIRQALIDKYGKPGTKKAPGVTHGLSKDRWAAFAGATYVFETLLKA